MQKALRMTDPSAIDGFQPHGTIRSEGIIAQGI